MIASDVPFEFERIPGAGDVAPCTARAFSIGRYEVAVFNVGGELFALENTCPHQGGPLADGWLEDSIVTCPWHGWCFNVRTGKMTLGEFARVPRFAVERDGSDLLIGTEPLPELP
jgi:nitrite reductase/ring-hydroxylating ferredoxin subunit